MNNEIQNNNQNVNNNGNNNQKVAIICMIALIGILIILVVLLLVKSMNKDNSSNNTANNSNNNEGNINNNDQSSDELAKFKNDYPDSYIINSDGDFTNEEGFKLDSKNNVKLASDNITELMLLSNKPDSNNLLEDKEFVVDIAVIISWSGVDLNNNYHLYLINAYSKNYLSQKINEYFGIQNFDYDSIENYDNEVYNVKNYYITGGFGQFGGERPQFESMKEQNENLELTYRLYDKKIIVIYEKYNNRYILKSLSKGD